MATAFTYCGTRVALATRHGKQRVIGRALRHGLGAELLHLPDLDTDSLGSFCGSLPRRGSALDACLAKARLALDHGGTGLAIASEGSFGPHPAVPLLPLGVELMVFLDEGRGLTIHEQLQARRTNFSHRLLAAPEIRSLATECRELERWLLGVGFPSHGLIVRPHGATPPTAPVAKGIRSLDALLAAIAAASALAPDGAVLLETDMRAHCNPTRMASIRELSFRLMRRLASTCPRCGTPGWGVISQVAGLPCGWCGLPTALVHAERLGCPRCDHQLLRSRPDGRQQADPAHCDHCNP